MIEDILPRYQETGTGSKKTFTLPFDPISDTYLKVYLGESLTTDYTVNEREVTFGTAPGKGVRVTFVRLVPLDWQDPSLGSINSESINNICTTIVAKMQSLEEEISRCVKVGITETNDSADVLEQLQNAYDILSSSKNLLESLVAEKTTALTELNNVKTQSVNAINSLASSKESEISDYTETEKAEAKREILETKNSVETDINNFAEPIKNEMVTLRDTTRGYKDSAEGFRNESENFKDRCEELVKHVEAPNWGDIIGNINDQTDLQNALNAKANDSNTVHKNGDEEIADAKKFIYPIVHFGKQFDTSVTTSNPAIEFTRVTNKDNNILYTMYLQRIGNTSNPYNQVLFRIWNPNHGTEDYNDVIKIGKYDTGGTFVSCSNANEFSVPTPGNTSNSTQAVNTQWFNQKIQYVSTLPASPDSNVYYFTPDI